MLNLKLSYFAANFYQFVVFIDNFFCIFLLIKCFLLENRFVLHQLLLIKTNSDNISVPAYTFIYKKNFYMKVSLKKPKTLRKC